MKKCLAVFLTAALLLCAAPLSGFTAIDWPEWDFGGLFTAAHAAEITERGTCGGEGDGSNLSWTLDKEGTLTISGKGAMHDYYPERSPWERNRNIKTIIIQNGITNIGRSAFRYCSEVTTVNIPKSVTYIGIGAFGTCQKLVDIKIPESVTGIGDEAFIGCSSLTELTFPEGVISIGPYAFDECNNLASVTIPNSVTNIYQYAFDDCTGLKEVNISSIAAWCGISFVNQLSNPLSYAHHLYLDGSEITNLVIPYGIKTIKENAFCGCTGLISVTIPDSVKNIESSAFSGCTGLTNVTIPDGVTSIGSYAFGGCTGLTSITIPDSVTNVDGSAISGCTSIEKLTIGKSIGAFNVYAHSLHELKESLKNVVITDGVEMIPAGMFSGCTKLTNVTIPDSVTDIGDFSFMNCESLADVNIPQGVKIINERAFKGCVSLAKITIPDGVTEIGISAFSGCTGLKDVMIPDSITKIGRNAFEGCNAIETLTIGKTIERFTLYAMAMSRENLKTVAIADGTASIPRSAFAGCTNLVNVTIPDSVTAVGENAFEKTAWYDQQPDGLVYAGKVAYRYKGDLPYGSKIVLKDGTTGIADFAFKNCYHLSEITIPDSVTNIGQSAFYYCYNLSTVEIPVGVTSIGDSAFSFCRELKSIEIPSQVTSIGKNAFLNCNSLTAINAAENNSAFFSEDGILFTKDKTTLLVYPADKDAATYTVPGTVTSIADGAFNQKRDLISSSDKAAKLRLIVIPDSVTEIGQDAIPKDVGIRCNPGSYASQWAQENNMVFTGDPNIIQAGRIGEDATYQIDNKGICTISGTGETWNFRWNTPSPLKENNAIKKVVIEKGVTSLGNELFYYCEGLTAIEFPDTITSIGNRVFYNCSLLTGIKLPNDLESVGESAFSGCGITEITIPAGVTFGYSAFSSCKQLERVTFAEGFTGIGESMFAYCDNLREVVIPASVKSIGAGAFTDCENLPKVTVDKINSIGRAAFSYCDGLTDIKISEQTEAIGDAVFYYAKNLQSIDVAAENKNYTSVDGVLFNKELTRLIAYPAGKKDSSYQIPDGVTDIVYGAFGACANLTDIKIPDSVITIGGDAFRGCSGLTSITLPGSLKSIGRFAFSRCSGLKSVTIPDGVLNIGDYAFANCSNLTAIVIPPSVTEMGYNIVESQTVIYGQAGSYAQEWAEKNGRGFISIVDAYLSLNAPTIVNETSVTVYGFSSPGATVTLFINGKQIVTTTAAASGRWNAAIPLTGAKDGDTFTIKAAVTVNGKTAEQTATVTYKPDAILFEELTLNHSYYSVTIKGDRLGVAMPNFTFVPGYPLAFKIKVTNNDRINKLYVVSTKDGASKQMALTYDAASGCWFADGFFDEADKNYVPGVFTVRGVDKDGKEFDTGVTIKINFLIDPSGYAYEAVQSNKLEGVTAAVYYKNAQGHELLWNAETADQLNPIKTLSDGAFAWVVPEGKWQVRLTKDGYRQAVSEWMDVPPEYTNVYIPMVSTAVPEVAYVNVYADRAEITFSQYMDIASVNTDNVKFEGYKGSIAPIDKTETAAGSGVFYAKSFTFTPEKAFSGEVAVTVANAKNYAGKEMVSPFTATFTVAAEPRNLTAQDAFAVYGKTAEVTVSAENAAGKTVSVTCDSANVTLSAKTLTLDETGKATLTVTGKMPGVAQLTFTLDGTTLTAAAKVSVAVPGVPTEPEQPTDPENPATPTDPEGPDKPTDPENPATPTDPEGPDKPTYTLGDVDGDGEVSSGDARLALRASVQLEKYERGSAPFLAADADGNGEIESSDARTILRVSVKLQSF